MFDKEVIEKIVSFHLVYNMSKSQYQCSFTNSASNHSCLSLNYS